MWYVTAQKNGASALGLQRVLGLGSYQTAWTWLHKLRRAMVRPGRERLAGTVEADEVYIGGKEQGARGRTLGKKALVAVAVEEDGASMGRVRLRRIADASAAGVEAFLLHAVEPGSLIRTDGWRSYTRLQGLGYRQDRAVTGGDSDRPERDFPRVHRVAALLKRWLLGTHQGAVEKQHLDYYLDEFTFRFNRRTSRSRGIGQQQRCIQHRRSTARHCEAAYRSTCDPAWGWAAAKQLAHTAKPQYAHWHSQSSQSTASQSLHDRAQHKPSASPHPQQNSSTPYGASSPHIPQNSVMGYTTCRSKPAQSSKSRCIVSPFRDRPDSRDPRTISLITYPSSPSSDCWTRACRRSRSRLSRSIDSNAWIDSNPPISE